jgi:hypothetical protein
MLTITALGVAYCYFLYGPFLREADRACKAIGRKQARQLTND